MCHFQAKVIQSKVKDRLYRKLCGFRWYLSLKLIFSSGTLTVALYTELNGRLSFFCELYAAFGSFSGLLHS